MTSTQIPFESSTPGSIGMEIEFQLLNGESLDLKEGIMDLMKFYCENPFVKPEFIQNTVEIASPVCHSIMELEHKMRALVADVHEKCNDLGMAICGAGTHPFNRQLAATTPLPRYLHMEAVEGYTSHTQITFATHVHIGMGSGEEALRIMRKCKEYVPLLIALSANSPFWRGHDTDFAAFRHHILAATRSYGIPPSFCSWQEFETFMAVTTKRGVFASINDIHWDIRPRPHLGTIEVRVMDTQPTVSDAISLAAFLQALVFHLRTHGDEEADAPVIRPLHQWIERDNRYRAAHFGLHGSIYDENSDSELPMKIHYESTTKMLSKTVNELGLEKYIAHLNAKLTHINNADFQRNVYADSNSFKKVAAELVKLLQIDIANACV